MEKRRVIARILAIAGTALVWLPILAPVVLSVTAGIQRGRFLFDYLMPAELSFLVLAGGALLVAGALLSRSRRWLVIASLAAAIVLLVGTQAFAVFTGLASGEAEWVGWLREVATAGIFGYVAAVVVLGVGGALLVRDAFRKPPAAA